MTHPPDTEARVGQPRPRVTEIHVVPQQVWFACPGCGAQLEGYYSDPRGTEEVCCEECGLDFDIPADAAVLID